MQILLIVGIAFALFAVTFALQNNVPVMVSFMAWSFEGSLAFVLLLALGLGALIAGLTSSPTVIRNQWRVTRLTRQVSTLEQDNVRLKARLTELEASLPAQALGVDPPAADKPYVGLKSLIVGQPADGGPG